MAGKRRAPSDFKFNPTVSREGEAAPPSSIIDPRFAKAPISLIGLYNAIYGPQNEGFPNHLLPVAMALMDTRIQKLMMICGPGSGKALKNGTLVLTKTGWKPVETLTTFDLVKLPDSSGFSEILAVLPQKKDKLLKITFSDGREITCNKKHLWSVFLGNGKEAKELYAEELLEKINKGIKGKIPLAAPNMMSGCPSDLEYFWGGYFNSGNNPYKNIYIVETNEVEFITFVKNYYRNHQIARVEEGAFLRLPDDNFVFNFDLSFLLNMSGESREKFVAGFLDSALTITNSKGIFTRAETPEKLKIIQSLIWSLGGFAKVYKIGDYYELCIKPAYNPFISKRKKSKFIHAYKVSEASRKLGILSIEEQEENEDSTCICIADPAGLFICENFVVTHNSRLLLGLFPCWMLGVDPSSSFIAISSSEGLPMTFLRAIMQIIEYSPHFRRAFPDVRPDKETGWSAKTGLFVTGRPVGDSKASYICAGVDSSVLTGLHANHLIFDDLHDKDNSSSPENRKKIIDTYYSTLVGRGVSSGTRYIMAGRRWAEDDILGHLEESGDWVVMTLPAERAGQENLYYDITVPEGLSCIFTDPGQAAEVEPNKIQKEKKLRAFKAYYGKDPQKEGFFWPEHPGKRAEWQVTKRNSPNIAESVYQCRPGSRTGSIFLPKYFSYFDFDVPELSPIILPDYLKGQKIIQAWDSSHGRQASNAFSACLTGVLVPCNQWHKGEDSTLIGPAEPHIDIFVVDCYKARLAIDELLHQIRQKHLFWNASEVVIEEKSSGIPAMQMLPSAGVPLTPMKAWASKRNRAIDTIDGGSSSVQGWFKLGRIHFWAQAPWISELEAELKNFTGDNIGFKDQVDALVYLVAKSIKLSSGKITLGEGGIIPASELIAKRELANNSYNAEMWAQFDAIAESVKMPQEEHQFCMTCDNLQNGSFCSLQKRKVSCIDSCVDWKSRTIKARSGQIILPSNISLFGGFTG